jgi:hypothetical protein
VQRQRWHKKQKYEHDSQLKEKQQHQSPEFFFFDLKEMRRPGYADVPKEIRRDQVEQSKGKTDDKCPKEKVPEENDLFVFHIATFLQLLVISKKPDQ